MRDPRNEAAARLRGMYQVRVLEPSPGGPIVEPWFADDPTNAEFEGELPTVSPVDNADTTWSRLASADPVLAEWAADRWLGVWRRLEALPDDFVPARMGLHQIAFFAIAPARRAANGKIALRYTHGGFGTPYFGVDEQVRVDGTDLVVQRGDQEWREPISSLAAARKFIGPHEELTFHGPTRSDPDAPFEGNSDHVAGLSDWYGFVTSVLEEVRLETHTDENTSRVQIWPSNFDAAIEIGSDAASQRAAFGGSPGDAGHPEPYLYVAPWVEQRGNFWNDEHFPGASFLYKELLAADDQRAVALDFFLRGRDVLRRGGN